jgi:hypothetical protein
MKACGVINELRSAIELNDMPDLFIPGVPDEILDALSADGERSQRTRQQHALHLLECALDKSQPVDTCADLFDHVWAAPRPGVEEKALEDFISTRGRKSSRP